MGLENLTNIALYLGKGTTQAHSYYGILIGSHIADQSVLVPMTSSDLEMQDVEGQTFLEDLRNYAPIVGPRTTKFEEVTTRVGRSVFLGVSHASKLEAWIQSDRKFLDLLHLGS